MICVYCLHIMQASIMNQVERMETILQKFEKLTLDETCIVNVPIQFKGLIIGKNARKIKVNLKCIDVTILTEYNAHNQNCYTR